MRRNRFSLIAVLVLVVGLIPALGARAKAPDINLDYQRYVLGNGLRLIVHEDHAAPIVSVAIFYHVGSKNEPTGKHGFAHLFEHLMFNGSENFNGEWFDPLQKAGASAINGSTWLDRTNYFQTVPKTALDLVLWLESDRMGHLLGAVDQAKLDEQRGVVENEKRQGDNQPYRRAETYNLSEGLFPADHPYHHSTIGSVEDLDAATLDTVHQWFKDYYGPNNAVLSISGDVTPAEVRAKVERYFGDIPAGPPVDHWAAWIPVRTHDTRETVYDNVPAVKVERVWAVPDRNSRDRALLDLAAAALGQGLNSRLTKDLVYDRQVASDVSADVEAHQLASIFEVSVTLKPGQEASVASDAIEKQVSNFLKTGPTAAEMERAIAGINSGTVRSLESTLSQAFTLGQGELYDGDPAFVKTYLGWINSATRDDVRQAAMKYLATGSHQVDILPDPRYAPPVASNVDRSKGLPAIPSESPSLTFPKVQTATLSNGMKVVLAERHTIPAVNVSIQFDAGYAADAGHKLGVANFTMNMLKKGTKKRDALAIAAEAERLGARLSSGSGLDTSTVGLNALTSNLEPSLALWTDIITSASFPPEEIERLRAQQIASIAQEQAQPVQLALRLLPPVLYGDDHAYGVPLTGSGTVESTKSITRDDLIQFRETWLRPDNATVFVVGDTTLEAIKPMLEKAFRNWHAPDKPLPKKNVSHVAMPSSPRVILIDKPGAPQSLIMAGEVAPPSGAENNVAIDAMNDVLGGQFTSRINMNLREAKHWSYGAQTLFLDARGQRPFIVYAPVQTDKTGDSLKELVAEVNGVIKDRPVTEKEMTPVIQNSIRKLPGSFERSGAVLSSLEDSATYGRPYDYPATLAARYNALKLGDLNAAAKEVVHPSGLVWLIVGDRAKIEDQVKAADIAPIEFWTADGKPQS